MPGRLQVGKQINVNDKREGTETAPDSVQRIIADLESIDRRLGEILAAQDAPAADVGGKAHTLLRSAIEALTPATPPEANEETGTAKRRVKIKAESEITAPADGERAAAAIRAGAPAKSGSRGSRSAAARRAANADKTPPGLLARLGAAETPPVVQAAEEPSADSAAPVIAEDPLKATADRLAQLEAEIADLTEAVTAVPTRPAATARPIRRGTEPEQRDEALSASAPSNGSNEQAAEDTGDGEDAEITIIGADGARIAPTRSTTREAPRVFREGPMPDEEEAEVEIKGDAVPSLRRGANRAGVDHDIRRRSDGGGARAGLGKWRIFRGSD